MNRVFYIYILASDSRRLYVGMTSDIVRRVWQHRTGSMPGFTRKYRVSRLVHLERTSNARAATARERELKGWRREKKLSLVKSANSGWLDLSASWFADPPLPNGQAP